MTTEKYYSKIVETALRAGDIRQSRLSEHPRLQDTYGLIGLRNKHFLNSLLGNGKFTYLELGVYRGASMVCGLYRNPEINAYGVDNWHYSPIDHPAIKYKDDKKTITIPWDNVKLAALDVLKKYYLDKQVKIIEKNWLQITKADIPDPVDIVHIHPVPGVLENELLSYLNSIYPLIQTTSILVMELHTIGMVPEVIKKWCASKKVTIDFKYVKDSDSLHNGDNWWGGLGVYILTKQEITK